MAMNDQVKTAFGELMFTNLSAASQIEEMANQIVDLQGKLKEVQAELDALKNDPKFPGV